LFGPVGFVSGIGLAGARSGAEKRRSGAEQRCSAAK